MAKSAGAFTGGKLSLKGDKKKPKKKTKNSKHGESTERDNVAKSSASSAQERSNQAHGSGSDDDGYHDSKKNHHDGSDDEGLTAAEKRSRKFKIQRERKEMEHVVSMSHRERVEQFNEKLGKLTELNDIPRVSAAGNG
ncbi:hypothetical protein ACHAW5_004770 [Stephanodiscus triporus]|uniref:DUF1754-domain-containing protein n=1 Tax=Stephanodiscus triporus TaxID=2934178 RepID=A0ABD3Q6Q3_9STRA